MDKIKNIQWALAGLPRVIPAKSTPEASNQTAGAEEVEEEKTNILLRGRTNMRQIREADNQVDRSNAAY